MTGGGWHRDPPPTSLYPAPRPLAAGRSRPDRATFRSSARPRRCADGQAATGTAVPPGAVPGLPDPAQALQLAARPGGMAGVRGDLGAHRPRDSTDVEPASRPVPDLAGPSTSRARPSEPPDTEPADLSSPATPSRLSLSPQASRRTPSRLRARGRRPGDHESEYPEPPASSPPPTHVSPTLGPSTRVGRSGPRLPRRAPVRPRARPISGGPPPMRGADRPRRRSWPRAFYAGRLVPGIEPYGAERGVRPAPDATDGAVQPRRAPGPDAPDLTREDQARREFMRRDRAGHAPESRARITGEPEPIRADLARRSPAPWLAGEPRRARSGSAAALRAAGADLERVSAERVPRPGLARSAADECRWARRSRSTRGHRSPSAWRAPSTRPDQAARRPPAIWADRCR